MIFRREKINKTYDSLKFMQNSRVKPCPNNPPNKKAEEERRYIAINGAAHTVFHDMYIINQCLDKSIAY